MTTSSFKVFAERETALNSVKVSTHLFSGGEVQAKLALESVGLVSAFCIEARLRDANGILTLIQLVDILSRNYPRVPISAFIPYVPYARQDRACEPGESCAITVMAKLINSCNFSSVTIWDPHSDVTTALIDRCTVIEQHSLWAGPVELEEAVLVSPDAGANKKCLRAMKSGLFSQMVRADKTRDTKTGAITGTVVYADDLSGRTCVIMDDICDGGRTFIELGKALKAKGAAKVILYVTHGIFSQGLAPFTGSVDAIYCANPWPGYENTRAGFYPSLEASNVQG